MVILAEDLTKYSDNYQLEINRRKAINKNDPTILELDNLRNIKIGNDPLKYMKYAQNPEVIWQQKAENTINPTYNMEKLATQQKFDAMKKAASSQLAYVDPAYDKLVDRTKDTYTDTKNMVSNETLNRGFGRSSYAVDKLTDVGIEENQAIGDINAERTSKINEINSAITMYDQQLADSLSQMDIDKAAKIAAKIDDLKTYYDTQKMQNDQFNLQKSGQEFNQGMQTKQFDLSKSGQEFSQNMQTKQFDYTKDMDLKKFTYTATQDKIQNALNAGQLSVSQANAALSEAKFKAENDPDSLDNQIKRATLIATEAGTAQTKAETENIQKGLTPSGGQPSGTQLSEAEILRGEESKLYNKIDSFTTTDKKGNKIPDEEAAKQWILSMKYNIINTFGKEYYDNLAYQYGIK